MNEPMNPSDICMHLGDDYDRYLGAIVPPLFQNTLFTRKTQNHGYRYSRINNPTVDILEAKLAARVLLRNGGDFGDAGIAAESGRPRGGAALLL